MYLGHIRVVSVSKTCRIRDTDPPRVSAKQSWRGGRNVEQKRSPIVWGDQDWGLRQELLDLVKCLLGLGRLFKVVGLLQKPIEGETLFAQARDEAAKRGEAPCNSLYPLHVLNRAHPCDG